MVKGQLLGRHCWVKGADLTIRVLVSQGGVIIKSDSPWCKDSVFPCCGWYVLIDSTNSHHAFLWYWHHFKLQLLLTN